MWKVIICFGAEQNDKFAKSIKIEGNQHLGGYHDRIFFFFSDYNQSGLDYEVQKCLPTIPLLPLCLLIVKNVYILLAEIAVIRNSILIHLIAALI